MNNIGDPVYFSTSGFDFKSGVIIGKANDNYLILSNSIITRVDVSNNIYSIDDKETVIGLIRYEEKVKLSRLKDNLKSVKRSFYQDELREKYADIRTQIINTAIHMKEDLDDTDFENRLKAICSKKKDLFSIKCEKANEARKHNGEVKYKMNKVRQDTQYVLNRLDDGLNWYNKQLDSLKNK